MLNKEFIFSDKRKIRITRHLVFWIAWYVYFAILHAANPFGKEEISYFRNPVFTFSESVLFILAQLPLTYITLYWILPKFILKKKYLLAFISMIIMWTLGGFLNYYLITYAHPAILKMILPERYMLHTERPNSTTFFMAFLGTYKGAFTVVAIGLVLKFSKYWYVKEQRNLQLQKENTEAQLQLLTAQVHPHFLFNTLNNIYSKAQTESPGSAKMIIELSHILRYVLDEGKQSLVPLENELQMLTDYINLEKLRYDDKLDLHISFPAKTEDVYIAPLLLLPFVENSFKHGTSKMIHNAWINLKMELKGTSLYMKLMNGKKNAKAQQSGRKGTGIENIKMRLELLYEGKYDLQISEDDEVYVINLNVELVKLHSVTTIDSSTGIKEVYA